MDNKVIVLNENETQLLKEELEDLVIQANKILQAESFKEITNLIQQTNKIVEKFDGLNKKLDNFDSELFNKVVTIKQLTDGLEKLAGQLNTTFDVSEQFNKKIEERINNSLRTFRSNVTNLLDDYVKKAFVNSKKNTISLLKEFDNEITKHIENAKKHLEFFEQKEIFDFLKNLKEANKSLKTVFYFNLVLIFALIVGLGVEALHINKMQKELQVMQQQTQQILQNTNYNANVLYNIVNSNGNN